MPIPVGVLSSQTASGKSTHVHFPAGAAIGAPSGGEGGGGGGGGVGGAPVGAVGGAAAALATGGCGDVSLLPALVGAEDPPPPHASATTLRIAKTPKTRRTFVIASTVPNREAQRLREHDRRS